MDTKENRGHKGKARSRFRVLLSSVSFVSFVSSVSRTKRARRSGARKADVTPLVEHSAFDPATPRASRCKVSLPEGLHTQSNKPRDPLLIPTELTIDAPAGVTVKEIVFPPSTDLKQAGQDQPLAVFEQTFAIGVQLAIAAVGAGRQDRRAAAPPLSGVRRESLLRAVHRRRASGRSTSSAGARPPRGTPDPIFATIAFGNGRSAGGHASAGAAHAPAARRRVGRRHREARSTSPPWARTAAT